MTSNSQIVFNRCQNCKSLQTSILHNTSAISISIRGVPRGRLCM